MSHLRQNVITKDWVIFATERSKRPHEFARSHDDMSPELPIYKHGCPFCKGNENPSEAEYFRIEEDERGWRVRIIPNKYPALKPIGDRIRHSEGIHRSITGVGYHEVLIEHPDHNATIALMESPKRTRLKPKNIRQALESLSGKCLQTLSADRHSAGSW